MRLDLHVHNHHEDSEVFRKLESIMSLATDLNEKIDAQNLVIDEMSAALDAFVLSNEANFQALMDALASNDQAAVAAAIAKIEASTAKLVAARDKITAADAADNPPAPPA